MPLHGSCCGPDAANKHRDCPHTWAGWRGEVHVCSCDCHQGAS